MDTKLTINSKQITPIQEAVESLMISTPNDMAAATEMLSQINKKLDTVVEYKEKKTVPLNALLKEIRSETKPLETALEALRDQVRAKMSTYQTAQKALGDKLAADIAARIRPGKGNLSPETGVQKIAALDTPAKEVVADSGSVIFITVKQFEITDYDKLFPQIMDKVIESDRKHGYISTIIRTAMKQGVELPGVRYYETEKPRNSR